MRIAVTGGTGFLGSSLIRLLLKEGYSVNAWYRSEQSREASGISENKELQWVKGALLEENSIKPLLEDCDAMVHAALYRPGSGFQGAEGDLEEFVSVNVMGSLQLFEAARKATIGRVIFISTCAVYDEILEDRPLDETHPLWPRSHYGAHKAAIEKFIHSYGLGGQWPICSLRPTGIYGIRNPLERSKWYHLVQKVCAGESVSVRTGGKEVHVDDVSKAIELLLTVPSDKITGKSFNCYDRYISEFDVATFVKKATASSSLIEGPIKNPKHQIETAELQKLGMSFGESPRFHEYLNDLIAAVNQ